MTPGNLLAAWDASIAQSMYLDVLRLLCYGDNISESSYEQDDACDDICNSNEEVAMQQSVIEKTAQ